MASDHSSNLKARYNKLSEDLKILMQLTSVFYCGASRAVIQKCLGRIKNLLPDRKAWTAKRIDFNLKTLKAKHLLNTDHQPDAVLIEFLIREAVRMQRLKAMSEAVMYSEPNPGRYWWANYDSPEKIRNLRLAMYQGNQKLYGAELKKLKTYRIPDDYESILLKKFLFPDFDPDWYLDQPEWFLSKTWEWVVTHCVSEGIVRKRLIDHMEQKVVKLKAANATNIRLLSVTVMLMIHAGLPDRARALLDKKPKIASNQGLVPLCMAMKGETADALPVFESDLAAYRKQTNQRTYTFKGLQGIVFLLAYLCEDGPDHLEKGSSLARQTASKANSPSLSGSVAPWFRAMFACKQGQDSPALKILDQMAMADTVSALDMFFVLLARYVVLTKLDLISLNTLKTFHATCVDNGSRWLALESAVLLERAGKTSAVRVRFIQRTKDETGMISMVEKIRIEELWERSLSALIKAGGAKNGTGPGGASVDATRVVWCVPGPGESFKLTAKEQKMLRNGNWSKGRDVSLKRLLNYEVSCLSPEDENIVSAMESNRFYSPRMYGGYDVHWPQVMPALIGHPRMVQADNPSVPVEFIAGEPEVEVRKRGERIHIKLSELPDGDASYTAVRETPTRYRIIRWTDKYRELATILGLDGLNVPKDASERVLEAIAGISSHVTVQSDIGGTSEDLPSVEGDPTPIIHLTPAGGGFRVEMFVRPFVESGPYLKPGQGTRHLIAETADGKAQAVRNLKQEQSLADGIEEQCLVLVDSDVEEEERHWVLEGPEPCLELLQSLKKEQDEGRVKILWPEGEKLKIPRMATFDSFDLSLHKERDWFELSGDLKIGDEAIMSMKSLLELVRMTPGKFIPLGEDTFLTLSRKLRRRLEEIDAFSEGRGKQVRINPMAALALDGLDEEFSGLTTDDHWKERFDKLRATQALEPELPSTLKAELRDYQVDGFRWLCRMAAMGLGACLADDMGLGKTVQALALILTRAPEGPTLVVAPTSVCANWQDEAEKFAPTLNPIMFGGKNRQELVDAAGPMDLVVCSYGLLQNESDMFADKKWQTVVLDEAQAIKNAATKRNRAAMGLDADFRLITTGTPLENHLMELHSLFSFINPGLLGSRKRFSDRFAGPVERNGDKEVRRRLRKLVRPFILRRIKSEVLEELPARTDVVLKVTMSEQEAAFYEAVRQHSMETLEQVGLNPGENHLRILAEITRLRQAACNPRLLMENTAIPSAKLEAFGSLVEELRATGHKALVFSQFVSHLNLIREFLDREKIDYRYLDGSTPAGKRKKEVAAFQAGEGDLFLISLKAGGTGLNLTAADYVIHMDPWWNPAVEDQASDRAHRIGQDRPVTVYRLVGRGTIEEKIVKLHHEKRELADSLLEGTDMTAKVTAEDLLKLIREEV